MSTQPSLHAVRWDVPPPADDRLGGLLWRWRHSRVGRYPWRRDRGLLTIGDVIRLGRARQKKPRG
jgi:hypothetical protein